jgi:transglutaminase-like putative cysteine protease
MPCVPIAKNGSETLFSCENPWEWANLLCELAKKDEQALAVRWLASAFSHVPQEQQPQAVLEFVQKTITYQDDRPSPWTQLDQAERFSGPETTLALGFGDCDDSARLVRGILRALGWDARLVFFGPKSYPAHVTAAIRTTDETNPWYWLDASLPAKPGEHPISAKKRT